jgi:hypothetical protein
MTKRIIAHFIRDPRPYVIILTAISVSFLIYGLVDWRLGW